MDHREAGRYWDGNADAWTFLARRGCDIYRDNLNTPAFLAMLPDVTGRDGLDIGCGEGHNTREVAARGARIVAVDIARRFVAHAAAAEPKTPHAIAYCAASAVELPFPTAAFDFATSFMCFMDVPEADIALREAFRVLKPGGFLQFSICHPCFDTPHRRNLRDERGTTYAIEVGRYFDRAERLAEWLFGAAPETLRAGLTPFRVPCFHRPLADWLNAIADAGFVLERVGEPSAADDTIERCPAVQDTQVVAYFLHLRCRKPA